MCYVINTIDLDRESNIFNINRKEIQLPLGAHLLSYVFMNSSFKNFNSYLKLFGLCGFISDYKDAQDIVKKKSLNHDELDKHIHNLYSKANKWIDDSKKYLLNIIEECLYKKKSNAKALDLLYSLIEKDQLIRFVLKYQCTITPHVVKKQTNKSTKTKIEYVYSSNDIFTVLLYELIEMISLDIKVEKCLSCNRFFISKKGHEYCDITLVDGIHTCRELKDISMRNHPFYFSHNTYINNLQAINIFYDLIYEQKERQIVSIDIITSDDDIVSFDKDIENRIIHYRSLINFKEPFKIVSYDDCYNAFIKTGNALIEAIKFGDYMLRYNLISLMISASSPEQLDLIIDNLLDSSPFTLIEHFKFHNIYLGQTLPTSLFSADLFEFTYNNTEKHTELSEKIDTWQKELVKIDKLSLDHSTRRNYINELFDRVFSDELRLTQILINTPSLKTLPVSTTMGEM